MEGRPPESYIFMVELLSGRRILDSWVIHAFEFENHAAYGVILQNGTPIVLSYHMMLMLRHGQEINNWKEHIASESTVKSMFPKSLHQAIKFKRKIRVTYGKYL